MSDTESALLLIVAALYLSDCVLWVRPGAVVFRRELTGRYRVIERGFPIAGGRLILAPLLPLSRCILITELWPLTLTAGRILPYRIQQLVMEDEVDVPSPSAEVDAAETVVWSGHEVLVDGEVFLRLSSEAAAGYFARALREALAANPAQRQVDISAVMQDRFGLAAATNRIAVHDALTGELSWACGLLFLWLAVGLPTLIMSQALSAFWLPYLIGLVAVEVVVLRRFHYAHAQLLPEMPLHRVKSLLTMMLAPTAAARAPAVLGRELLAAYDPLVAARLLLNDARFVAFAGRVLRDLHYPRPVALSAGDVAVGPTATQRSALRHQVERLIRETGIEPEDLLASPQRDDPTVAWYCPRCLAQFRHAVSACSGCGGVRVLPLR